ncbi:hypothetical protein AB434_1743 [Heyndrickxia coagulans]|uniref:Uncharacterized protein n=1 Tax=Heyndrickxia coagulans TaxID=1398 RepID=A0AAN0WDQ9_HEYCO|nr:hypothetical protein SB48_HM08orf05723 [Heyndrickxia coagulans]AKN54148.1 hypothetical protein AB434_1743 [Heyndrickxia coagulans]
MPFFFEKQLQPQCTQYKKRGNYVTIFLKKNDFKNDLSFWVK